MRELTDNKIPDESFKNCFSKSELQRLIFRIENFKNLSITKVINIHEKKLDVKLCFFIYCLNKQKTPDEKAIFNFFHNKLNQRVKEMIIKFLIEAAQEYLD